MALGRGKPSFKVNWEGRSSGFIIGISAISDTAPAKIGFGFDPAFTGTYDDVTRDVMKASWKRGRANDLGPMNAGETTWTLKDRNADGTYRGRYNRQNPASPLVQADLLRPNRPAKIEWINDDGTILPIAYGWLRTGTADASTNARTATFSFIDLFEWLDTQFPVIAPTGPITVGQAYQTLLAACGWTNPAMMALDDGPLLDNFFWNYTTSPSGTTVTVYHSLSPTETIPDSSLNLQSALQAAEQLNQLSLGAFFQRADGVIVHKARGSSDHLAPYAGVSTVADSVGSIAPGFDLEKVKNQYQVTLQNLDGSTLATVVYVDDESDAEFGTRIGTQISTGFISNTATAIALAAAQCSETADPDSIDLAWQTTIINKTDRDHSAIVNAELQKVLTVIDGTIGQTAPYVVESIAGTMEPAGDNSPHGAIIRLNLGMMKRPTSGLMFVISNTTPSQIGGPDAIKYG